MTVARVMAANGTGIIGLDGWKETDPQYAAAPYATRGVYWLLPPTNRIVPLAPPSAALPASGLAAVSRVPTFGKWLLLLPELNAIENGTIVEVPYGPIRAATAAALGPAVLADYAAAQARLTGSDTGVMMVAAFGNGVTFTAQT